VLSVPEVLGAELTSGGETVRWKVTGNTLGACIRYLQQLANWMSTLPKADRSSLLRAPDELQEPASDTVTAFPFRYVQLWADANPNSLGNLATMVETCSATINKGEVALIRNGLEHYREGHRFPASDRILSAIAAIVGFVSLAQRERLYPRMFWRAGSTTDSFRQTTYTVVDNRGDIFRLNAPLTVRGAPRIQDLPASKPILIAPGNLFGLPNADLLLGTKPEGVYSRYWSNYPFHGQQSVFAPAEDIGAPIQGIQPSGDAAQRGVAVDGA
jgi:hypothetical protein